MLNLCQHFFAAFFDTKMSNKKASQSGLEGLFCFLGAENGIRTRDLNLGKVALYQLSYFRIGTTKVETFSVFPNFFSIFCIFAFGEQI